MSILADCNYHKLIARVLKDNFLKKSSILGFVDAELMLAAQDRYQIDLFGPSHLDQQWQSRHDPKFSGENFSINWERKKAICPAGKESLSWLEAKTETAKPVVKIKFSTKDCQICPFRSACTKTKIARRTLTILPKDQFEMQRVAREREKTRKYKLEYRRRSGIEGTMRTGGQRVRNAPFEIYRSGENSTAKCDDSDGGQLRTWSL